MSQEIFFAQQQASVTSFNNLIRHLGGLQKLQTQNLLSSLQQRNDESLEALRASRLRLPDANDWREYLIDASAACCSGTPCASAATTPWPTSGPASPSCCISTTRSCSTAAPCPLR